MRYVLGMVLKMNLLKQRINDGELTIGSWITLGNNAIAEILANAGFDWLVVDLEHTTISLEQAGELIRTIELSGVPSIVTPHIGGSAEEAILAMGRAAIQGLGVDAKGGS